MIFIEFETNIEPKKRQPANYVRRSFRVEKPVRSAVLKMTALGVYKSYLNGERLDEQEQLPGYTDYEYRLQYQEYDVTRQLLQGENVLAAVVGDGWYRGAIGIGSQRNSYGTKTGLGAELTLIYEDGSRETVGADARFKVTREGALRENDLKVIERYDARKELPGWNAPGFDDSAWAPAIPAAYGGKLVPEKGEKILRQETFTPEVLHTPDGSTVLDFHQNHSGRVTFTVTGRAGQTVKLTMGETLDENGNFTMKNLVAEGASIISGEVGQELEYTLKEGTQTFEPFFLISGYRYVKLENWPEAVKPENFVSTAIYSDLREIGTFECSNELINRFVEASRWSRKANFVDIPTDCPTRERAGWTGDMNVYAETALYMTDIRKFLEKWFEDFKLEQGRFGNLPYAVPEKAYTGQQRGTAGWSDALGHIATELYKFYGDPAILENVYDTVKKFIDFRVLQAKFINPLTILKKQGSLRDRSRILELPFHYGEWQEPGVPMVKDFIKDIFVVDTEVTAAWFYQSTRELSEMAEILGKTADAAKYGTLADRLWDVYQNVFLNKGYVEEKRMCRYVRPLGMGLATEEQKKRIAADLVKKLKANSYHIATGFLTTYLILDVLTDNGYPEDAYKLLENEEAPGWLYEVKAGGTTTWENWAGLDENGKPTDSLNHFAPGAMVAWLFKHCAGIRPLKPGFEEILIEPKPGGTLTFAKANFDSVRGTIVSSWERDGETFTLQVTTPDGVLTTIRLPNGSEHYTTGGTQTYTCELQ